MGVIIVLLAAAIACCFIGTGREAVRETAAKKPKTEEVRYEKHTSEDTKAQSTPSPSKSPVEETDIPSQKDGHKSGVSESNEADVTDGYEEAYADDAASVDNAEGPGTGSEKLEDRCTISIDCHTVNDNLDKLKPEKRAIIPDNGIILQETEVEIKNGETVFDILKRVTREKNIHLEFSKTPAYNSIYIEGINNLYEFDCGSVSGWMYSVNGEFPKYSSSQYEVNAGDDICFLYTCELGKDIGDTSFVKQQ